MLPKLLTFALTGGGSSTAAFNHLRNHFDRFRDGRIFIYFSAEENALSLVKKLQEKEGAGRTADLMDTVNIFEVRHLSYIIGQLKAIAGQKPDKPLHIYMDLKHEMGVRVTTGDIPHVYFKDEDVDQEFQSFLFDNPNVTVEIVSLWADAMELVRFAGAVDRRGGRQQ
jgi:hypothetical protein